MGKFKYTLGIDPSGAFKEGKGTTGWCILDNNTNKVLQAGTIAAKEYASDMLYWQEHLNHIAKMKKQYKNLAISIEDYVLYKAQAMAQVNSQLETVQLLGIIKLYCYKNNIKVFIRPAVAVKKRWSDDILVYKNIITKVGTRYMLAGKKQTVCEHERDAIRHAMHFNTFENKEDVCRKNLLSQRC